jgi:hypothetical protein
VSQSFCIKPSKPTFSITQTSNESFTLASSASSGNQWYLDGTPIPSGTGAIFLATVAGIYKVQVVVDDCASVFSDEVAVIVTGDLVKKQTIDVYPNPSTDYLNLAGINGEVSDTQLVDLSGKQYPIEFEKHPQFYQVKLNHLTHGVYLLQFKAGGVLHRIKVVKKNN